MLNLTHTAEEQKSANYSWLLALGWIAAFVALFLVQDLVSAAGGGGKSLSDIAKNATTQVTAVASLLVVIAYVAGVGFMLAGVVQFKAHKDNPAQVPLSKPIVYLIVGSLLLFLPTLMRTAGQTVFAGDQEAGSSFSGKL